MFGRTNAHPSRPRPLRETGPPPRNTSFWSPLRQQPPPTATTIPLSSAANEASVGVARPQRIIRNATVMTLHSDSELDEEALVDESSQNRGDEDDDYNTNDLSADTRRALNLHENDDHFPWHAHSSSRGDASPARSMDDSDRSSSNSSYTSSPSAVGSTDIRSTTTPRRSYFTNQFDWSSRDHSGETTSDEDVTPTKDSNGRSRGSVSSHRQSADAQQHDQPIFGDHLLTPMGFDEEDEFLRHSAAQGVGGSGYGEAAQRFQTFAGVNEFDESDQIGLQDNSYQVVAKNRRRDQERILENKRRQGKLLLVSLLDNFCLLYDQSPERNRKLFYVICKTLSNMGIIDEEYLEEMSAVRSSYQRAFRQLVLSALTSIKQEQLILESRRIMAPPSTPTTDGNHATDISRVSARLTEPMVANQAPFSHTPSIAPSLLHGDAAGGLGPFDASEFPLATAMNRTFSFGDMFDNDPTRYKHDFVEIKKLGRGGFASVFKARNKLDGIEYAIKKIRLRGGAKMRYEKIFREIKFLARLDHKNVVRYYSSWLEHADYPVSSSSGRGGGIDDGEDEYGDDYDDYEDDTYATRDDDPSTQQQQHHPFRRPPLIKSSRKKRSSALFEQTVDSSRGLEDELSMGIVFGADQSLDFSNRSIDEDISLSISFEQEGDEDAGCGGIAIERTGSNSTVTGRDIPRRPSQPSVSSAGRKHKSPSVSLEMQGRVLSWERADPDDATDHNDDYSSASLGKMASSYRTSSSIEEIQRSLPSSLNDSSLGSRFGRFHGDSHSHGHRQELDSIEEIDACTLASYPPRRQGVESPVDVHPKMASLDHRWMAGGAPSPRHKQRHLHHRQHPQQPMFTRELTLFIQMQLCQTTLQDYLRYRNDQRETSLRRGSVVTLATKSTTTHKKVHKSDRFGMLSSSTKSSVDAHAQSAPGSPLSENPKCTNSDLVDPAVNQAIFRAIVDGVAYIHEQDMIHRDLKPGNIFLSVPPNMDLERLLQESVSNDHTEGEMNQQLTTRGTHLHHRGPYDFGGSSSPSLSLSETLPSEKCQEVLFQHIEQLIPKIGDFGLVTDMDGSITGANSGSGLAFSSTATSSSSNHDQLLYQQQKQHQTEGAPSLSRRSSSVTNASSRARTTAIGTVTYASPEQLARPNMGYDQKADIYSLGIIFFELYYPFSTLMERHAVLRTLRNGELPPEFVSRWPKEAAFVLWLMADDPAMRPTAREILEFDLIRKAPSPRLPELVDEDPMCNAGSAAASSSPSSSTAMSASVEPSTATNHRQMMMRSTTTTTTTTTTTSAYFDEAPRESSAAEEMRGLNLVASSTGSTLTAADVTVPVSNVSSVTMLLTAAEAMEIASSMSKTIPALYFSNQPICERCQMHCRCTDVQAGHHSQQQEDEMSHEQEKRPQHLAKKPDHKRRPSKCKSNSHHQRMQSQDNSTAAAATAAAATAIPPTLTAAGTVGGVSLEAKLKRMEQSLAAMRLENKALLDRIQQLEYEKAMAWNPTLMDDQNDAI